MTHFDWTSDYWNSAERETAARLSYWNAAKFFKALSMPWRDPSYKLWLWNFCQLSGRLSWRAALAAAKASIPA
jgi:hypothetical protein